MATKKSNALNSFWSIQCLRCNSAIIFTGNTIVKKIKNGEEIVCPGCGSKIDTEVLKSAIHGMLALECSLFKIFVENAFKIEPPELLHPGREGIEFSDHIEGQNLYWRCSLENSPFEEGKKETS